MKSRTKQFIQHLTHDIDDGDRAEEYLDESLPLIGLVVMYFNSLEKSLASLICEVISDRTDAPGLIVIQKLMYAVKVDLFKPNDSATTFTEAVIQRQSISTN